MQWVAGLGEILLQQNFLAVQWYYTIVQCTFILEDCYKVKVVSKDGDEVVVRSGDNRRDV